MSPHSERNASKFQAVGGWKGTASLVEEGENEFADDDKHQFHYEARRTVGCSITLDNFQSNASGDTFMWKGSAVVSVESNEAHKIDKETTDTWEGAAEFSVQASLFIWPASNTYSIEIGKEREGSSDWLVHKHRWYGKELSDKEPWAGGDLPAGYDIPLPSSGLTLTHHREKKGPIEAHTVIVGTIDMTWNLMPADDVVDRAIRERLRRQLEKQQQQTQAQRAKAKKAAAGAAVAMNDTGAVLAGAAAVLGGVAAGLAVTGVGVPAAAGVAVIAGLASGIAWYTSGRYQELANDPPRDDFQKISLFKPSHFNLHKPAPEFEATWQNFVAKNVLLASAMRALIVSLERYDGAAMVTEVRSRSAQIKQIEAIVHNATACVQQLEAMAALRSEVNVIWKQHRSALVSAGWGNDSMALEAWPDKFNQLWRTCLPQLRDEYNLSPSDISEVEGIVHQRIKEQKSLPTLPRVLLDASWANTMKNLAAQLRSMSTAYDELKKILL